ncbi:hypothetical protein BDZ89DRAFT_1057437 [Hymenopellis radicata]|nr:hypothetical protein BDZ89DRAFT_1057437 [Hymenopellis radicata]
MVTEIWRRRFRLRGERLRDGEMVEGSFGKAVSGRWGMRIAVDTVRTCSEFAGENKAIYGEDGHNILLAGQPGKRDGSAFNVADEIHERKRDLQRTYVGQEAGNY